MKSIRRTIAFVSLALVLALLAARSAYASKDPCEADLHKYCPGYTANDPLRYFCLKGVSSQVTPSCKATLRDVSDDAGASINACAKDTATLCGHIIPGNSRILKCLKENTKKLDFECRKKVVPFPNPK